LCYRWFGIVLLPLVSFSADGTIALWFIIRNSLRSFITAPEPPDTIAEARAIDMSIQFLLFWMPLVTLIGWWADKPMTLLFGKGSLHLVNALRRRRRLIKRADLFEVVLLVGACFLVNYVTADAKTNWAEGWVLLSFYVMIVSALRNPSWAFSACG
jgi:Ca2+:H+ antiporter